MFIVLSGDANKALADLAVYQGLPSATRIDSPLTPLDSSEARNAIKAATSSGVATLPGGYKAARSAQISSDVIFRFSASARAERSAISVRTQPGNTPLAVIP